MPGNANWKTLYHLEHMQLYEEGYPVGNPYKAEWTSEFLPSPYEGKTENELSEQDFKKAYEKLWKFRGKGLRSGFPFVEPNDYESIINDAENPPLMEPINKSEYAERVKGAWFGRCAGVILGKPFEMDLNRLGIKAYLESAGAYPLDDWAPVRSEKSTMELRQDCQASFKGNIQYVEPDDDIHYTILALLLAEKKGLSFSGLDVGEILLDNIPYHWLWSATKQAYYHMVNLTEDSPIEKQIRQIPTKLNPWREGINGAIRADFWGYISPGNPRRAAKIAHQAISFNMVKNGIYGAMFVAGCISAALCKNPTVDTILQGGLSVIPKKSRLAAVIEDVTGWYTKDKEWIPVCDKIYEKYGHLNFSACLNNMAFVVLSLIHGQLDYSKTIATAVMCGTDTDCTGGTAGSIVGAVVGYQGLDPKWILPLNDRVKTVVAGFGEGRITDLVQRTIVASQLTINP